MEKEPQNWRSVEKKQPPKLGGNRINYAAWIGRLLMQAARNNRYKIIRRFERRKKQELKAESRRIRHELRSQQFS